MDAALLGIAGISCARVTIITIDRWVSAANAFIAYVKCASITIIASICWEGAALSFNANIESARLPIIAFGNSSRAAAEARHCLERISHTAIQTVRGVIAIRVLYAVARAEAELIHARVAILHDNGSGGHEMGACTMTLS